MDVKQKQRAVIEFLLLEECEGDDIVLRLQKAYGRDAYCRASLLKWMNEIRCGSKEFRNEGRPGRPYRYETDVALRSILQDDPNASLRTIADTLLISPETLRIHILRIGHTLKLLRRIPHAPTSELKQVRFNLCFQLLRSFVHMRTIIGGIASRGMGVGFMTKMFGTGYGPHGMRTRLERRRGPLPPRKPC
jgi:hypothetical protein